jgi:cellulose synthase/poly-beta-1,6-N-acetylglucosamine synthase-like glycosyltransferase
VKNKIIFDSHWYKNFRSVLHKSLNSMLICSIHNCTTSRAIIRYSLTINLFRFFLFIQSLVFTFWYFSKFSILPKFSILYFVFYNLYFILIFLPRGFESLLYPFQLHHLQSLLLVLVAIPRQDKARQGKINRHWQLGDSHSQLTSYLILS